MDLLEVVAVVASYMTNITVEEYTGFRAADERTISWQNSRGNAVFGDACRLGGACRGTSLVDIARNGCFVYCGTVMIAGADITRYGTSLVGVVAHSTCLAGRLPHLILVLTFGTFESKTLFTLVP